MDHEHDWVYSPWVAATLPPIYTKICKICGKIEEEQPTYHISETYDEIFKKFHGGKTFELQKPL